MNDDLGAGRFCPADYRYPPVAFARDPDFEAETIYVVGGLYGNRLALDAIERMAEREAGEMAAATRIWEDGPQWHSRIG